MRNENRLNWKKLLFSLVILQLIPIVASPATFAVAVYLSTGNTTAAVCTGAAEAAGAAFGVALASATTGMSVAAICAAVPIWGWFALGLFIGFS